MLQQAFKGIQDFFKTYISPSGWYPSVACQLNGKHCPRKHLPHAIDCETKWEISENLPRFPTHLWWRLKRPAGWTWSEKTTANHLFSYYRLGSTLSFQRDVQQLPELYLQSYLDHLIDLFLKLLCSNFAWISMVPPHSLHIHSSFNLKNIPPKKQGLDRSVPSLRSWDNPAGNQPTSSKGSITSCQLTSGKKSGSNSNHVKRMAKVCRKKGVPFKKNLKKIKRRVEVKKNHSWSWHLCLKWPSRSRSYSGQDGLG